MKKIFLLLAVAAVGITTAFAVNEKKANNCRSEVCTDCSKCAACPAECAAANCANSPRNCSASCAVGPENQQCVNAPQCEQNAQQCQQNAQQCHKKAAKHHGKHHNCGKK